MDKDLLYPDVAKLVSEEIARKGWNLEECCDVFNQQYKGEIEFGKVTKLEKNFVSRVCNGRFKLVNDRISKFCEFLGIDLSSYTGKVDQINFQSFFSELQGIEKYANNHPEFKSAFPKLTEFAKATKNFQHKDRKAD